MHLINTHSVSVLPSPSHPLPSSSHPLTFTWSPLTLSFIPHPLIHPTPSHSSLTLSSRYPLIILSTCPILTSPSHPPLTLALFILPPPIIFIHSSYLECTCIHSPLAPSASSSPSFPLPYTGLAVVQWERGCGVRRT